MKLQKNQLRKVVKNNTNITLRHSDGSSEIIKNGCVVDAPVKHPVNNNCGVIGMSKGITKNMGDFESLRVDVWLSVPYQDENSVRDTYNSIESVIDEVLEDTVSQYLDDGDTDG